MSLAMFLIVVCYLRNTERKGWCQKNYYSWPMLYCSNIIFRIITTKKIRISLQRFVNCAKCGTLGQHILPSQKAYTTINTKKSVKPKH